LPATYADLFLVDRLVLDDLATAPARQPAAEGRGAGLVGTLTAGRLEVGRRGLHSLGRRRLARFCVALPGLARQRTGRRGAGAAREHDHGDGGDQQDDDDDERDEQRTSSYNSKKTPLFHGKTKLKP